MKALFIGGTGTISMAIVRRLAEKTDWEVWLLNRGRRAADVPEGVHTITADVSDEKDMAEKLKDMTFDTVCEFIGFTLDQVERDWRLFNGKTRQYIYISSASAYLKPAAGYVITEGTTLANPYWEYSRNKIDYESIPESTRQRLLAATYKMAQEMFRDPKVVEEYEIWHRQREERKQSNR